MKRVIYFPWNVICPPAGKRESAVYFFVKREMGNVFLVKRDLCASRETWFLTLFIPEMRMEFSVIHIFYRICRDPGFFVPPLFGNLVHKQWQIWGWGVEGRGLRPPSNLGLGFSRTMSPPPLPLPLPHTHTLWQLIVHTIDFLYEPTDSRRRNAHKKTHCFCTPTAFPDSWGTRISKFSPGSLLSDPSSLGMFSCLRKPPISECADCGPVRCGAELTVPES